jgi:hypothetical protein
VPERREGIDVVVEGADFDAGAEVGKRECIGIELPQNPQENQHFATLAAQNAAHAPTDSDLAALVAAWSHLPNAIKAGILAMIRAAGK